MAYVFQREIGGKALIVETGELAQQANGAVIVRYGDTIVLVTACVSATPREGVDFLPLTVDYEERLYAAGKIPGGYIKREGRPSQEAILTGRLTDRAIRPLFPKSFRNDIQVIITVLSADQENDPDILAMIGASAALGLSEIPFNGPIGACRIGYLDGEYVVNPTFTQLNASSLDLVIAGTRDAVMMVEAGAKEVPEAVALEAVRIGQEANRQVVELQEEMVRELGKPKMAFVEAELRPEILAAVSTHLGEELLEAVTTPNKKEREEEIDQRREELLERLGDTYSEQEILSAFEMQLKKEVRNRILEEGIRPDGRGLRDVRPVSCKVGILPRTHGSGLFNRGQTQVLTIATLGALSEEQRLDGLSLEETKRFMHHYNFPPFSTGETKRLGSPGRREIGHGALAERALLPVIPDEEAFPYTIRLVSEVLSSNGSTSMASVCGSTLSLMDAGVPIKAPVAGVAMGLVMGENGNFAILTDIQGMEDALGDMDFKVAGTAEGITALQMDIKVKGITYEIMEKALAQAREARLFILGRMLETIGEARPELSQYAPRMVKIMVHPDKIRLVIGPGGKTIRSIIEETKATIDVEDDGSVIIGSNNEEMMQKAISMIRDLTRDVEVGGIYTGKVTRITNFGAFVEILPGKEGLVRIGELADYHVPSVEDVVKIGDEITVMVTEIDRQGRINLSRRAVLQGVEAYAQQRRPEGGFPRRAPGPRPLSGPGRRPEPMGPRRSPNGGRGEARPAHPRPPFGKRP